MLCLTYTLEVVVVVYVVSDIHLGSGRGCLCWV